MLQVCVLSRYLVGGLHCAAHAMPWGLPPALWHRECLPEPQWWWCSGLHWESTGLAVLVMETREQNLSPRVSLGAGLHRALAQQRGLLSVRFRDVPS